VSSTGTSIVILPDAANPSPRNSSFLASNFFSYSSTQDGYLSYGWWLPAGMSTNTSHCRPDNDSFHWVEFAAGSCDWAAGQCVYHITNVPRRKPKGVHPPPIPEGKAVRYVVKPLHIGNGEYGDMALSYADGEAIKAYGIGTRQILSGRGDPGDEKEREQCRRVVRTVKAVVEEYKPKLGFAIQERVCEGDAGGEDLIGELGGEQKVIGEL